MDHETYGTGLFISHSALSFALFEIAVPHYPLFSLLYQKIDVFLKKMVTFFWGATSRKVLFQMSKLYVNLIWTCRFQIISNKRQKFQKPKKNFYLKTLIMNFEQPCWKWFEIFWNHLKSNWNLLKSNWNLLKSNWNLLKSNWNLLKSNWNLFEILTMLTLYESYE